MPGKITQIVIQKKRKNRCSIFLDDEYAFGLDQDVVVQFGLKKGDFLTDQQIDDILFNEEKKKAKDRALRFLSYRDRSEKEIRTKLKDVGYDDKIVEWVISELKRLRFIDDRRFALNYAQSQMLIRPKGEYVLKRELKQKGIDEELIDQTIEAIYQEKDQLAFALELAQRRKKHYKIDDEMKVRKRVSDFLLRRGFGWDIVSEVMELWDQFD